MTPGVLILHGYEHSRPREHWLRWLAAELRERGVHVQYPQFPAPEHPDPETWKALALAELEMLGPGGTVVAHSLGTVLWSHFAASLPADLSPAKVALFAPPSEEVLTGALAPWQGLAQGGLDADRTVVIGKTSDPYRPEPLTDLAARWGVPHVELEGEGHLTPADGYGPFPAALAWTLNPHPVWL